MCEVDFPSFTVSWDLKSLELCRRNTLNPRRRRKRRKILIELEIEINTLHYVFMITIQRLKEERKIVAP